MSSVKKTLVILFISLFIINIIIHTVYAQENNTTEISKENAMNPQNASFSETPQKSEVTKEDILIEAQRNFEMSLSILNVVAALMGVVVTILAVVIAIVGGLGFFEIKWWKENRKKIEGDAAATKQLVDHIGRLKDKAEKDINTLRSEIEKIPYPSLSEKPSKEIIEKFDEFSHRLETLELLGISLKPEDYFNRGVDLYYKGKYGLSTKAFEKAIELDSNNPTAWFMKASVLVMLQRYEEALKAIEKAIELKPDEHNYFVVKASILGFDKFKRLNEAIETFDKAIELKPDDPTSWHGKGLMFKALGRFEEALEAFDKAIKLNPDYAEALYARATIEGEKNGKLSNLKKAIKIDKSYKKKARDDKHFEKLWDDEDFKELVE